MAPWIRMLIAGCCLAAGVEARAGGPVVDIPYEEFTLGNGLRVIVHTDRKAPVIAVNLWYHVGAKDEPAGRSGFAHLFEHLMVQGSEHRPGEYFSAIEQVGAIERNGSTNRDRTNYYQTVPTTALEYTLFLESDRMGHLLGAVGQADLDTQRDVVKNEKRLRDDEPYGLRWTVLMNEAFPRGHPYQHNAIGSMNDLDAASLADVKAWFQRWYGPNNAILVLAGDIDLATAKREVPKYFGHIPASASLAKLPPMPAPRQRSTRYVLQDRVAQTRINKVWNAAPYGDADVEALQLLAMVLGGDEASRLSRRLRGDVPLVDRINTWMSVQELAGTFNISMDVRAGVDPARVEQVITEELTRLLAEGPGADELELARAESRSRFIRGFETVHARAEALNECATFTGNPGCFRDQLERINTVNAEQLMAAGRRWLGQGDLTLLVVPGTRAPVIEAPAVAAAVFAPLPPDPRYTTLPPAVDRSQGPPPVVGYPDLVFPAIEQGRLANGMKVVVASRPGLPLVELRMDFPGGTGSDAGGRLGTAKFTMDLLAEGAGDRDGAALRQAAYRLGARIGTEGYYDASMDQSSVTLSALTDQLEPSLALYADVIRRPRFDADAIERMRSSQLAGIGQERTSPRRATLRLLLPAFYPAGHAYAMPFSGRGDEAPVAALQRDDAVQWHARHVRPDTATVLVVGDTTLDRILPLLERHFGDWRAPDVPPPRLGVPAITLPAAPRVLLLDVPGAAQSSIGVGQAVQSGTDRQAEVFDIGNRALGGAYDEGPAGLFGTRLNMNLREDKHWVYEATTMVIQTLGPRPWVAWTAAQTDKTAETVTELRREITDLALARKPVIGEELARVKRFNARILPGMYQKNSAVLDAIGENVRFGRTLDDTRNYPSRLAAMTPEQVRAAMAVIRPEALTWVIAGDLARIEAGVRALNLGHVSVVDAEGQPAAAKK